MENGKSDGTEEDRKPGLEEAKAAALLAAARRPLSCQHCGQTFTIPQNLRRHERSKHLGFRFPCRVCPAEATRRRDLLQHYQRFHPQRADEAAGISPVRRLMADGRARPLRRARRGRKSALAQQQQQQQQQQLVPAFIGSSPRTSSANRGPLLVPNLAVAKAGQLLRPPADCDRVANPAAAAASSADSYHVAALGPMLDCPAAQVGRPVEILISADVSTPLDCREGLGASLAAGGRPSDSSRPQEERAQSACGDGDGSSSSGGGDGGPQRVVVSGALDPVSQFRLERIVAERASRITEHTVIETLDKAGHVVRRETIDREYFLNGAQ